jgi:hypothetical protein
MTKLARACALLGYGIAALLIAVITYDIILAQMHAETVSRWLLDRGRQCPGLPFALSGLALFIVGGLIGHLWWPRPVGSPWPILFALAGGVIGLFAGAYLGHVLLAQRG